MRGSDLLSHELETDQSDLLPEGSLNQGGDSPQIEDLSAHSTQLPRVVMLVPEPANAGAHEPLAEDAKFKLFLFSGYFENLSVHLEFGKR